MRFHVLGPLEVTTAKGEPVELNAGKPTTLLAVLLLHANSWVNIDDLIDAIWHGKAAPASALRNLRSYVWRLRQLLGDRVESRAGAYRVVVAPGELDTDRVDELAAAARHALDAGAHTDAAAYLSEALTHWRGVPFDRLTVPAAAAEADLRAEQRRELRTLLAGCWRALDRYADATAVLRELLDDDPFCERTWATLVRVLHAAGRPAQALAAFQQARRIIVAELGVEPGPALVAAQREVLGPAGRDAGPAPAPRANRGGTEGRQSIEQVIASAEREVLIISSGANTGPVGAFRRLHQDNAERGVRYRAVFPDAERLSGKVTGLALAGALVRTDNTVPMEVVVIDGSVALLPVDASGVDGDGVAVLRLPSAVGATVELFERMWSAAVVLNPVDLDEEPEYGGLTTRERDLLALLWAGYTDGSAGAKLGISVRTVRRTVADIMNRLGARSRFQAGAKAVDRGWLLVAS
ncbi:BTAD domain-containing putative transcriptional regulator [Actinophytocola sp. NPDC049390]|uniref:BTAD domain-containing putative transcriptional regulator n=1 Tax=Actinophytocola sp. NPDC049390 TaxID=3363894 RepID=UPI0037AC8598